MRFKKLKWNRKLPLLKFKKIPDRKKRFLKCFSVVAIVYIAISFTISYDDSLNGVQKIAVMYLWFMAFHFTYKGLEFVDRIYCCIEEDRRLKNDNSEMVMEETS